MQYIPGDDLSEMMSKRQGPFPASQVMSWADQLLDALDYLHTQHVQHVVLTVQPQREFCWKDAGWNSWFVYGQRCRWLEPQGDGTVLFTQELLLDGPFAGAASHMMGEALRDGMAAETAALKQYAERT